VPAKGAKGKQNAADQWAEKVLCQLFSVWVWVLLAKKQNVADQWTENV
jgi:hypothetical protein